MGTTLKQDVTLNDKYEFKQDRVYLSGIQALVRLPLLQRQQDALNGLNTAGFVSGYRGSPLGGLDITLDQAKEFLDKNQIHFQPGINEDLGATAVWGSQQTSFSNKKKYDGVVGYWYGKGPGVDRSGDVIKHANAAGTDENGGVLMYVGDDHTCKSSTFPHQSEHALIAAMIPMLAPSSIEDILEMGILGISMSRYSGCWVGLKCLTDLMDSSASVPNHHGKIDVKVPTDFDMPENGLNIRWPDVHTEQEQRLLDHRLPAVQAFAYANNIDKIILDDDPANLTLVATGKSYTDLRQALSLLNINDKTAKKLGINIYKVGLVWPLEPRKINELKTKTKEFLVLEEKRPLIENQIKEYLYHDENKPLVTGKTDTDGNKMLPSHYELTPVMIAESLINRLANYTDVSQYQKRIEELKQSLSIEQTGDAVRKPYYCSGCPHNTSTKVPEGSRALAGIGCHYMAQWIYDRTGVFTQMGGEGVPWIGQAPFTDEEHVFVNLGDGTYQHSGILAVRACLAADVNVTFKVLYNDAVAMTGGQIVDGGLYVDQITRQLAAEGVKHIYVVSDDIEKYETQDLDFAEGTIIRDRSEMARTQRELRKTKGVSVIVYDQTCAAEKRRRRKRGLMEDPKKRVFINEQVCEGCGDCGEKSNCVSILPIETEFGRKRQIDQSSCNKDYSCVNGFCPSFVTIEGVDLKKPKPIDGLETLIKKLPEPTLPKTDKQAWSILLPGIGGTGVVTIGALLAMAAHLEGKAGTTLDQIGLAQKGGSVMSHIKIADHANNIHSIRVGMEDADLILGADLIVSSGMPAMQTMSKKKTHCLLNTNVQVTGDFTQNPDWSVSDAKLVHTIQDYLGTEKIDLIPATQFASKLLGNSIATNIFLVGFAWQKGLIPLSMESIFHAIEMNGVAVTMNKNAFGWGRLAAHDLEKVKKFINDKEDKKLFSYREKSDDLEETIDRRFAILKDYQNKSYAKKYIKFVKKVKKAEKELGYKDLQLTKAVAKYLFKLMAYKDEYEVARLYTQTSFMDQIQSKFEKGGTIKFHLAPPLFTKKDKETGHLKKSEFGPWIFQTFKILAKMKFLRGTPLDIFGYTKERRVERRLIKEYRKTMETVLNDLNKDNLNIAIALASLPEEIRGFGHVKEKKLGQVVKKHNELLAQFHNAVVKKAA